MFSVKSNRQGRLAAFALPPVETSNGVQHPSGPPRFSAVAVRTPVTPGDGSWSTRGNKSRDALALGAVGRGARRHPSSYRKQPAPGGWLVPGGDGPRHGGGGSTCAMSTKGKVDRGGRMQHQAQPPSLFDGIQRVRPHSDSSPVLRFRRLTDASLPSPVADRTSESQRYRIFSFANARSCMTFDARKDSRRWTIVTVRAKRARNVASSGARSPPPTTMMSCSRKKNPSQVASRRRGAHYELCRRQAVALRDWRSDLERQLSCWVRSSRAASSSISGSGFSSHNGARECSDAVRNSDGESTKGKLTQPRGQRAASGNSADGFAAQKKGDSDDA
jgi:hypothetical protein